MFKWLGTAPRNPRYKEALALLGRAILREHVEVEGVMLSPTTAFLVRGRVIDRYLLSADLRAAIAQYVEGLTSSFKLGSYKLEPAAGAPYETRPMADAVAVLVDRK